MKDVVDALISARRSGHRGTSVAAGVILAMLGSLVVGCGSPGPGIDESEHPRPNIVWITLDACRTDLGCYGYHRPVSPNLDALAARGVLFENNFAQATFTLDSVPSFLTGRYFPAPSVGSYSSFGGVANVPLPAEGEFLLSEVLGEHGYRSAMITLAYSWFSHRHRLARSFDEFVGIDPANPPLVTFEEINAEAFKFLEQPREAPFFLYLHAWDTHFPHEPGPIIETWVDPSFDASHLQQSNVYGAKTKNGEPFSDRDKEYLRAVYDGSVLYADTHLGKLLDRLDTLGLLDDTIVVVGSDHGDALGEDGFTIAHAGERTFDEVTHVPLIMAGPGLPAGQRIEPLTENVDIVPTLLDLLGIAGEANADGVSLLPLIRDPKQPPPRESAFTKCRPGPMFSLRGNDFRYELDLATGDRRLFPAPDRVASRVDVLEEHPEQAAVMYRALQEHLVPRWEAYNALPLMAVFVSADLGLTGGGQSVVKGSPLGDSSGGDSVGKWKLHNGSLFARGSDQKIPPLEYRQPVPNGSYTVMIEAYADTDFGGTPASSMEVKINDDAVARVVATTSAQRERRSYLFVEIGQCTIEDGLFETSISPGDPEMWTAFKGFALVPRTDAAEAEFSRLFLGTGETRAEAEKTLERLRALGYLE